MDWLDLFLIFTTPLGTKWILPVVLAIVLIWQAQVGGSQAVAALFTTAIERGIKLIVGHPGPFLDF